MVLTLKEFPPCCTSVSVTSVRKSIPPSPPSKEERIQRLIDLGFDVFPETALEKQDW